MRNPERSRISEIQTQLFMKSALCSMVNSPNAFSFYDGNEQRNLTVCQPPIEDFVGAVISSPKPDTGERPGAGGGDSKAGNREKERERH
jgi:hypothetical protein